MIDLESISYPIPIRQIGANELRNSLDIWRPVILVRNDILDSIDSWCPYTSEQDDLDFFPDLTARPSEFDQRVQSRLPRRRHIDSGEYAPCYIVSHASSG